MISELMCAVNVAEFGVAVVDGVCQGFTGRSISEHLESDTVEITCRTSSNSVAQLKLLRHLDAVLSPNGSDATPAKDSGEEPQEYEPEEYEPEEYEPNEH